MLQPRFEETPDGEPRVAAVGRTHDGPSRECFEEGGVMTAGKRREILGGVDQLMAEAGRSFTGSPARMDIAANLLSQAQPDENSKRSSECIGK